jgi:hypothetical protein
MPEPSRSSRTSRETSRVAAVGPLMFHAKSAKVRKIAKNLEFATWRRRQS